MISGAVLVHNNEKTIRRCIESQKDLIDELIIIDDNSTDNTTQIIKEIYPDAKIFKRPLDKDFASQRNFALSKLKNKWTIFIDSDEELSRKLKKEILATIKNPKYKAYISRRDNLVFNKFYPSNSGRPILLEKKLKFEGRLHENVFTVKKGYLKGILYHRDWNGVKDMMDQLNKYSGLDALKWYKEKRDYNLFQILLIATVMPFYSFFQHFIFNKKYRGGILGFIYSLSQGSIWIFKALKYYELKYTKNNE